jgi:hypothetical protein
LINNPAVQQANPLNLEVQTLCSMKSHRFNQISRVLSLTA